MNYKYKKITIITGEYGCGKTNLSVNLALDMKKYGSVAVIDLDIVNPYFRTADFVQELGELGIDVICPEFANTSLDIPVLNFDIERIIQTHDYTVIDVGGSDAGAFALGRYKRIFDDYSGNCDLLYLFSMYRSTVVSAEETVILLREIETACRLRCTGLVNSSNLGPETTMELIEDSSEFADKISELSGLDVVFRCIPENIQAGPDDFPVKRKVKLIWEE